MTNDARQTLDPVLSTNALVWPVLQAMKELGGEAHIRDIEEAVIKRENLSPQVQAVPHGDSGTELNYRLRWARTELKYMGAIENVSRGSGVWRVTPLGEALDYDEYERLLRGRKGRRGGQTEKVREDEPPNSEVNSDFAAGVRADGFATFGRPDAPIIEGVARSILLDCLVGDGSILTEDSIWTLDNLAVLHTEYVDKPDTSGGSFNEKLEVQLADVPNAARQLFAELYILNILPVGNFKQTTKLGYIEDVLAPIEPPVQIPESIREAFAHGMFNGGRRAQTTLQLHIQAEFGRVADAGEQREMSSSRFPS